MIVMLRDIGNQSLLLGYLNETDVAEQDKYYSEIVRRIVDWNVLTGQRTHMPRHVVVDVFRRNMYRQNNVTEIPPDKIESRTEPDYDIDWFIGEDEEEELFKI